MEGREVGGGGRKGRKWKEGKTGGGELGRLCGGKRGKAGSGRKGRLGEGREGWRWKEGREGRR